MAKHLLRHCTGSTATLYQYVYGAYRFCCWLQRTPDQLIAECRGIEEEPILKAIAKHIKLLLPSSQALRCIVSPWRGLGLWLRKTRE